MGNNIGEIKEVSRSRGTLKNLPWEQLGKIIGGISYGGGYSPEWKKKGCYPEESFKMFSSETSEFVILEWEGICDDSEYIEQ